METNKLQAYFSYWERYNLMDTKWYEKLSKSVKIAQDIKKIVSNTNFGELSNENKVTKLNQIFSDNSNKEIDSIEAFCKKYFYDSENGISLIRQQLLTIERRKEISNKLMNSPQILIDILSCDDVYRVWTLIRELFQDNCYSVINRFVRCQFPEKLTSPDAPNRLEERIRLIQSKLGISITGTSHIDKCTSLLNYITSDDIYKKHMFCWDIDGILENISELKKATVYYGAPGTGKTYRAKIVAKQTIDQFRIKIGKGIGEDYHIETVQFHPSYSYEDFIEGIRPGDGDKLSLFNGSFKEFCKKAGQKEINLYKYSDFLKNAKYEQKDFKFSEIKISDLKDEEKEILEVPNDCAEGITIQEIIEPSFYIIDEINRADLSRVFGELMYSLEYRGYPGKIKTQYSYLNKDENANSVYFWENGEDWFFIPQNVYIIGTMNNIDRSVDSLDFALRRRFIWKEIEPDFDIARRILEAKWSNDLASAFERLNKIIEKEELLGKDYRIGHSYALAIEPIKDKFETATEVKSFLWNDFIRPLLQEYLRGLGDDKKSKEKLVTYEIEFKNNQVET